MSNIQTKTAKNSPRDYAEIGAAFLIVIGVLFALGQFNLLPKRRPLHDHELRPGLRHRPRGVGILLHRRYRRR
ncbi:MAG: hypothetical protein WBL55_01540 [Xanthobacteraceae bacterium]